MSSYTPHYRLTLYKPRSVDSTETAILVANGTVHSDNFKVITKQGVAGWQPYLMPPKGRKGRIDILTRKTDVGKLTFQILDKATTAGSNLSRWMSGFLGAGGTSIPGKVQFGGCKCLVEESTDDGSTWATFFTGRVTGCSLADLLTYNLEIIGLAADLQNANAFRGRPHSGITYACEPCLMPLGISQAFGGIAAIPSYSGTVNPATNYPGQKAVYLSSSAGSDQFNVITAALMALGPQTTSGFGTMMRFEGSRARVRLTTAGNTYEYVLLGVQSSDYHATVAGKFIGYHQLVIAAQDATAPLYGAIPADGSAVTAVSLRAASEVTRPGRPLFLADVHPVQLLADLLDGKFGTLSATGAIQRTYPRDSSSFTTLIADVTFPSVRFRITAGAKLADWIPDNLLKPFGLALYENGSGNLVVVDVRPPTTLTGLTTLTDADLDTTDAPDWSWDRTQSFGIVDVKTYVDSVARPQAFVSTAAAPWPDIDVTLTTEAQQTTTFELGTLLDGDFNERNYSIDATGLRSTYADTQQARDRATWVGAWANTLALQVAKPYAAGPLTVTVTGRRTANVTGLTQGGLCIIDCDQIPDPTSNLRGGAFIARILEKSEQGPTIALRCLVLGPNVTAAVPVVGTLGAGTNAASEVTAVLTVNANSDPVVVHTAVTATSVGSIPADTSALWTYAGRYTSSATVTLKNLPSGLRVWVRARSEPNPKKGDTTAASAWVSSTGTKFIDTTAITAPSSLTTSGVTAAYARLSWSNGAVTDYGLRIYLASGANSGAASAASVSKVIDLPPGTTYYDLFGLDAAGPWYKPEVCFYDMNGGESTHLQLAGVTFQATGTATTAPTPVSVSVYGSKSVVTATASPDRVNSVLPMGVPLIITPGAQGYGVTVERAPDVAGSPGTYATLAVLLAIDLKDQGFLFADTTAAGTTTYWYRAKHTQAGYVDSGYCTAISASARALPLGWNTGNTIYPVNRKQPMTDTFYAPQATDPDGMVIAAAVLKDDGAESRSIVTGLQTGVARHGDVITFSPAFQSIPRVLISGGALAEPRAKWGSVGDGTEAGAFTTTIPTYENFAPVGLTAVGFTVRARLQQHGTLTSRGHDALASDLTTVGATDTTTISNAPSVDDTYNVAFRTEVTLAAATIGVPVTASLRVAIQSDASGSYVEVAAISHRVTTDDTATTVETLSWSLLPTITGLSSTEHIKFVVSSFTVTGSAGAQGFKVEKLGGAAQEITYTTSSGDQYATKTPDTNDRVTWTAWGYQ